MLNDIMALAQKESAHAGHYYVGVEHLFIALTRLEDGVTVNTLEEQGIAPRFVRYMIRQEMGQGDNRRFWPGFRETPRLHTVVRIAGEIIQTKSREDIEERDLLLAILREADSIPIRVLRGMEVDLDRLEVHASNWSAQMKSNAVRIPIQIDDDIQLNEQERDVLQQMFRGYERVIIQRELQGGYSSARVLVACPHRAGGRASASVVVKLDERQSILYEKMRYDSYVRDTLPPATSRVVDNPIVPDKSTLGGLRYTFIRDPDLPGPVDLADYAHSNGPDALADLLRNSLFKTFGETWWRQRDLYQFNVWQEYEMLLPASLVVEVVPGLPQPRRRISPDGQWSRRGRFVHREVIALEGFTVTDFYPDRQGIQLAGGAGPDAQLRATKVEVRGIADTRQLFLGSKIPEIIGRVMYTRDDLLYQQAAALKPNFDLDGDRLPYHPAVLNQLPNPVFRYKRLLQRMMSGSLSTIHGDLHLHNVLVGPGGNAWLIDFAQTREGHTLFDWAVLEVSLLTDVLAPAIASDDWTDIWQAIGELANQATMPVAPQGGTPTAQAMRAVVALRQIVGECLAEPDDWREYYTSLAFCALRGLRWTRTLNLRARRLLFLVAALAMSLASERGQRNTTMPDMELTEINLDPGAVTTGSQMDKIRPAIISSGSSPKVDVTSDRAQVPLLFSAYHPQVQHPNEWAPMVAYAYRSPVADLVAQDALHHIETGLESGVTVPQTPREGPRVTATPVLEGFQFSPPTASASLHDTFSRFVFRLRPTTAEAYASHIGYTTLAIEGVIVADVPMLVHVDPNESGQVVATEPVSAYQSIFCSYSPDDYRVAMRVESIYKLLQQDYLRDVASLRSSANWQDDMLELITEADVFQLFWSTNAAQSAVVTAEWKHALQVGQERPNPARFVRPVYWAQPMPEPPAALDKNDFLYFPELSE